MRYKTSELSGMMLDYAVAQFDEHCDGLRWEFRGDHYVGVYQEDDGPVICTIVCECRFKRMLEICREYKLQHQLVYSPSTKWAQGGKIIESEKISLLIPGDGNNYAYVRAEIYGGGVCDSASYGNAPTALIAAMRAFVASKAGDTIELAGAA